MRWSGIWYQQYDGVVLMVESICGQGFAYAREVEEDMLKKLVKLGQENATREMAHSLEANKKFVLQLALFSSIYRKQSASATRRSIQ
jgi:hypothetical protein